MKKVTKWFFVETKGKDFEYWNGPHKTKKASQEHYKRLCAVEDPSFGLKGETVEYVKLTGTRK